MRYFTVKPFLVLLASIVIAACAGAGPAPQLNDDVRVVAWDDIQDYWIPENRIERVPSGCIASVTGKVQVKFLIDSNGEIFNPQFVGPEADECLRTAVIRVLDRWSPFAPSADNEARVPVQTVWEISFVDEPPPTG